MTSRVITLVTAQMLQPVLADCGIHKHGLVAHIADYTAEHVDIRITRITKDEVKWTGRFTSAGFAAWSTTVFGFVCDPNIGWIVRPLDSCAEYKSTAVVGRDFLGLDCSASPRAIAQLLINQSDNDCLQQVDVDTCLQFLSFHSRREKTNKVHLIGESAVEHLDFFRWSRKSSYGNTPEHCIVVLRADARFAVAAELEAVARFVDQCEPPESKQSSITAPPGPLFNFGLCCTNCGSQGNLSRCSRCRDKLYCGKKCQAEDWRCSHRDRCSPSLG